MTWQETQLTEEALDFDNDYVTYVSMDLEYPTIKSLNIEDSYGVKMLSDIPTNAPDGVGVWNQTMFAGNEYNIVLDAEDGNGWKDIEMVEIVLAPQETNYDSTIIYYPRNQTAWTNSDLFEYCCRFLRRVSKPL